MNILPQIYSLIGNNYDIQKIVKLTLPNSTKFLETLRKLYSVFLPAFIRRSKRDRHSLPGLIILLVLAGWLVPFTVQATNTHRSMVVGNWIGKYTAPQGETKLVLDIKEIAEDGTIDAIFNFSALPTNTKVPSGSFKMIGHIELNTRKITLKGGTWIKRPSHYDTVNLHGRISADSSTIAGTVNIDNFNNNINIGKFEIKKELQPVTFTGGMLTIQNVDVSKQKESILDDVRKDIKNIFSSNIIKMNDHYKFYNSLLKNVKSLSQLIKLTPSPLEKYITMPQSVSDEMRKNKFNIPNGMSFTVTEGKLKKNYNISVYRFSTNPSHPIYNFGVFEYAEKESWGKWKMVYLKIMTGFATEIQK